MAPELSTKPASQDIAPMRNCTIVKFILACGDGGVLDQMVGIFITLAWLKVDVKC